MGEKNVQSYEFVIDVFHGTKKFALEHMDAVYKGREVEETRDAELRRRSRDARDEISRAFDIDSFVLSDDALKALARYEAASDSMPLQETWFEYRHACWSVTNKKSLWRWQRVICADEIRLEGCPVFSLVGTASVLREGNFVYLTLGLIHAAT